MHAYVLAIAGAVLLSAVISIVAPNGKMGKFIKGAMQLVVLVVLVSPFLNWIGGGEYDFSAATELKPDTAYLEYCAEKLSGADEAEIAAKLKEEYSVTAEVCVLRRADDFSREKIMIIISDFGIFGQDERIDIVNRIRETVQSLYGCETEVA